MKKLLMLFIGCLIVQSSANAMGDPFLAAANPFLLAAARRGMVDPFPLHTAARSGDVELIESLLHSGANVDQPELQICIANDYHQSPLHYATLYEHLEAVNTLISHGANVNQQNRMKRAPLHAAASKGNLPIAQTLIASGANTNLQDINGDTPSSCAAKSGHQAIVALIDRVNNRPNVTKNQLAILLCAGHPRLGIASPAQPLFHKNSPITPIIVKLVRKAAFEYALYGHNQ